ncbi:uncharacterized protein LOC127727699 [Mytilus californianus]|uniref:uncharacterized protein LOC127727699 n=1 Tax=Mytilus californianus TaxID=6549 RepID=UPI0022482A93|nr:uncharacterized protein LOC127727699 [Mytilus californianus]
MEETPHRYSKDISFYISEDEETPKPKGIIHQKITKAKEFENQHIEYIFVLGQTSNITVQREINDESRKYKDIVQGNFVDSYRNLTYKLVFTSSIMSMDVIRKMYDSTKQVPFMWLEDVYGGGFLPWVSNIKMQLPRCFYERVGDKFNDISCRLVYLTDNIRIQRTVWETISNRTKFQCNC